MTQNTGIQGPSGIQGPHGPVGPMGVQSSSTPVLLSSGPNVTKVKEFLSEYYSITKFMAGSGVRRAADYYYFTAIADDGSAGSICVFPNEVNNALYPPRFQNIPITRVVIGSLKNAEITSIRLAVRFGGAILKEGTMRNDNWEIIADHKTLKIDP